MVANLSSHHDGLKKPGAGFAELNPWLQFLSTFCLAAAAMRLQLRKGMYISAMPATVAMPRVLPKAGMSSASQPKWCPQQQLQQLQPWLLLRSQGSAAAMTRRVFCVQLWMTCPSWWPARSLPLRQLRQLQLWPMPLLLPQLRQRLQCLPLHRARQRRRHLHRPHPHPAQSEARKAIMHGVSTLPLCTGAACTVHAATWT